MHKNSTFKMKNSSLSNRLLKLNEIAIEQLQLLLNYTTKKLEKIN